MPMKRAKRVSRQGKKESKENTQENENEVDKCEGEEETRGSP